MQALTEQYRPRTFDQMKGQPFAVSDLTDFADFPYPQAFLFSGPTGVGKTTAAFVLADALGVNREWNFIHIKSGEMDAEAVESALKTVRCAGIGDGWKMILCDEADMMSTKARSLWLSALEALQQGEYGKTVIVFTTNNPEKFDARFRDRCESLEFTGDAKTLRIDAQALLDEVWTSEGILGDPPRLDAIRGLVVDGSLSFRRLVRFIETESRKPRDVAAIRAAKLAASKSINVRPVSSGSVVLAGF